jgi:large subunit ribosomal protein L4
MNIEVLKKDGTKSGETVELKADIFEIEPNDHAIYQAVRSFWANQRQGTHKVKARNEVNGGGKKPFSQKKTGRARQVTSRSPLMPGGGSIFGPKPHGLRCEIAGKSKAPCP